jgi:hypothetical protein
MRPVNRRSASELNCGREVGIRGDHAVIIAPAAPDVVGLDAIRRMYTDLMKQDSMTAHFSTDEVVVANDLARSTTRPAARSLQDIKKKHLHILKLQTDGTWTT